MSTLQNIVENADLDSRYETSFDLATFSKILIRWDVKEMGLSWKPVPYHYSLDFEVFRNGAFVD